MAPASSSGRGVPREPRKDHRELGGDRHAVNHRDPVLGGQRGSQIGHTRAAQRDRARTVLDIPVWDFDNQGAHPIKPVTLQPFDTVKVTCRHTQTLRDHLPAFEGQPDRYVIWGEGTTDEMCLGIVLWHAP